jgi:hypothetical protein
MSKKPCTASIARHEGIAGFYRELGVNTVRAIPGAAIQFATYDLACRHLLPDEPENMPA